MSSRLIIGFLEFDAETNQVFARTGAFPHCFCLDLTLGSIVDE